MNSDDMAYIRGRSDAESGKERFPQSFHPNQYGAYNMGFYDWHKLQAFPDLLKALQALFDSYKALADSGDAGYWSLEDQPEGMQALAAIAKATGQ